MQRSFASFLKTSPTETSSMPSFADSSFDNVLLPLPGGPLIVIINYIPPIFNAFLVIWLTGIEHRKYQNNQYWNGPKS